MRNWNKWTQEEMDFLKHNYNVLTNSELAERFATRTPLSIYKKARKMGLYKDKAIAFRNRSESRRGENAYNFKGYRRRTSKGYIARFVPDHPNASRDGLVLEHRLVMSEHLGRPLRGQERVHHLNGNKADNRISNLMLIEHGDHTVLHHKGRRRSAETCRKIAQKAKERHRGASK